MHTQQTNGVTTMSWADRISAYREQQGISRKEFAEQSGLPYHTVGAAEKGNKLKGAHIKALKEFFDKVPAPEEEVAVSQYGLDATSQNLMTKVVDLAKTNGRIAGLVQFAFRHMQENEGDEVALQIATGMLRKYLASIDDPSERLDKLLELYDNLRDMRAHK